MTADSRAPLSLRMSGLLNRILFKARIELDTRHDRG